MTMQALNGLVSRFGLRSALVACVAMLPACGGPVDEFESLEDVAEAEGEVGFPGSNNLPPSAIASDPLKRSVTDSYGITTSSNPDPLPLCASGTVTSTGCTLRGEWQAWMNADQTNRVPMMRAIAKCAVESSFTIVADTFSFPGQWPLYPGWKTNRLTGQDKRERVSSCILSLLNGNDETLTICIIGPGGSPFSDACSNPGITKREGGFFGDLFAATPTAYVAGPDSSDPLATGRACFGTAGNYCCAESDQQCPQRIVLAGAILGSAQQNYANKRCNAPLVNSGGNYYCPSFFSTREPNRNYTNVFTTFVPEVP